MNAQIRDNSLWQQQLDAVVKARECAVAGYGGCLLDMDMGLGKTRVALEIAQLAGESRVWWMFW